MDAAVHVYDFRMTLDEVLSYIEQGDLPERFAAYDSGMRDYALVANGITYMQSTGNDILIYQGREEGREEGIKAFILDKLEDGVAESIIIQKLRRHFALDENTARQYYRAYGK